MSCKSKISEVCLSSVAEAVRKVMSVETPFRINDTSENYLSVHTAAIAAFTASNGSFHASAGSFQAKSLHKIEDKVSEVETHLEPRTPPPSEYRRSESKDCSPVTPSGGEHGKYPPSSANSDCYTSDSSTATTPMKWEPSSPPGGSHPYAGLVPFNFPALDEHKEPVYSQKKDQNGLDLYFCHLCSYTGTSRELFSAHMNTHFEHRCPHCDYTSRTEGRLKRHIKDFHSSTPPDNYSGNKTARVMPGRPKVYRCKQCEFVATEKLDFWSHARSHIKEDKLLQCPKCPFVTEYKHHLEYHLRNHFGSKPFKCNKCNYACVNKSMLNSHMKSHTNVYQYRCADCTYATKYCHSLKLHLRKYNHKPATVLNADGSLPQGLDAEAAGLSLMMKRGPPRGPRGPRKDKLEAYLGQLMSLPHLGPRPGLNGLISPYWPLMGQFPNGFHQPPPLIPVSAPPNSFPTHRLPHHKFPSMPLSQESSSLKCTFCPFSGENRDDLNGHMLKVHAAENQDLFNMFGITSESLLEEQNHRASIEAEQSLGRPTDFSQKSLVAKRPPSHPSRSLSTTESLHIRTDTTEDATKSSPRSWPPSSTESLEKETINSCKSMPELFYLNNNNDDRKRQESSSPKADSSDILRQMTLKFGSGPPAVEENRETPLDLTKPKQMAAAGYFCAGKRTFNDMESTARTDLAVSDSFAAVENSNQSDATSPSPRKRSRKGKAYKLDTISWKLQGISSEAEMPRQEDIYSNNSDVEGELDEMSNHSSDRDVGGHFSDLSPRSRGDLNMSGHSDDKEYTQFSDFKDGTSEEHDGSYLSEKLIKDKAAKECEQNSEDGIEQSSTGGDFEQIHQNLKILNEGEMEKKDGLHGEDRCPSPVSDLRRCSQGSSVGLPPLPVIGNGSRLLPTELQSQAEKNHRASGLHGSRRPGPSSAAVRRGAEIAWRILHPDQMNLSGPYQNGYSPVHNYQASERSPPVSMGNSHLPLMSSAIPATQKLPSKVNGMNGVISSNHSAHGKKLSREGGEKFECSYCDIAFRDCVMYTMHMGYHDYQEPFKCNMCGNQSRDKVEFFLHIARTAHA